jgi:cytochrome b
VVTFTALKVYGSEGHSLFAANNEISVLSTAKAEEGETGESNETGETGGKEGEKYWEEVHEAASYFMLCLIALHILGIVISSRKHKENLVKAMITGEKDIN